MAQQQKMPELSFSQFAEAIGEAICRRRLLVRGDAALLAVSGGMDSMMLLHVLNFLSGSQGWHIRVAHLNHNLRGQESDADAKLVEETCRDMGVECFLEKLPEKAILECQGASLESTARKLRHEFLARTAREFGIRTIVTAHHRDDQVEGLLLRLFRGSTIDGLGGMEWQDPSPSDPGLKLIRPMLGMRRRDILEVASINGLVYREDSSNFCLDHDRNWIRLQLIPMLEKEFQPALADVLNRTAESFREDADYLEHTAKCWAEQRSQPFETLHPAIQRRIVRAQLISRFSLQPSWRLIRELLECAGQPVNVPGTGGPDWLRLTPAGELVEIQKPLGFQTAKANLFLTTQGEASLGDLTLFWEITPGTANQESFLKAPCQEVFDADRLGSTVVLRHWLPGDRFKPIGMTQSVKLQDLFTNSGIDRNRRRKLAIALCEDGTIFWVEGLRIGEDFKVTDKTIRRLHWRWQRH